jgi:hypothetical protein
MCLDLRSPHQARLRSTKAGLERSAPPADLFSTGALQGPETKKADPKCRVRGGSLVGGGPFEPLCQFSPLCRELGSRLKG